MEKPVNPPPFDVALEHAKALERAERDLQESWSKNEPLRKPAPEKSEQRNDDH